MDVSEAVIARHSARAFLPKPVDRALLERLLALAARSPSGGNLQPWHITVVTGDPLLKLIATVAEGMTAGVDISMTEYDIYPSNLHSPYRERRFRSGEQLYEAHGITRENRAARLGEFARNFTFFGAPVGLFCHVDRRMSQPQWSDLGMYLQTLMLLLTEHGLASCAQEAWAVAYEAIDEFLAVPAEHTLFCGMAIGYPDTSAAVNGYRAERAPLEEFASFVGW
jgi:nitroreductase